MPAKMTLLKYVKRTSKRAADVASALQSAKQAIADGQAALAKGDFAAYGRAQDRLKAAIAAALSAQSRK